MKKLDPRIKINLCNDAEQSPRKRMNHNFHTDLNDPVQRLAIAMEPETYVQVHRHPQTWELLTAIAGRFLELIFDNAGTVTDRIVLGEDTTVLEMPAGTWHTVLSLESGSIIFEVKQGPYTPVAEADSADWSPQLTTLQNHPILNWFHSAQIGDRFESA